MKNIAHEKKALRSSIKQILADCIRDERMSAGAFISVHLEKWLKQSFRVPYPSFSLFAGLKDEICTMEIDAMLRHNHIDRVAPWLNQKDELHFIAIGPEMKISDMDLRSPRQLNGQIVPVERLGVILVPGRAFDLFGHRLGRGKGHYDRALTNISSMKNRPILVGLAFDEQILPLVPSEAHDIEVDFLCTPKLGVTSSQSSRM